MDINVIREKLSSVKTEIEKLMTKKEEIEKKVKAKQEKVDEYALLISKFEMDELKKSLEENGTSLPEILQALKNGEWKNQKEKSNHHLNK